MKQADEKTIGFVLKEMPYKENDILIDVYTYDYGRMSMIARGVKKLKSKNASACQTLTLSEFILMPKKGISTLVKSISQNYYRHIKDDLFLQTYATYFCEVIYKITNQNEPNEMIFNLLKSSFDYLENGYPYQLVYLLFNSKILEILGIQPHIDGCVKCQDTTGLVSISIEDGGFICQQCIRPKDVIYTKEVLKGFHQIIKYGFAYIDQIHLEQEAILILNAIVDQFIDEYSGYIFQSKKFMKRLNQM